MELVIVLVALLAAFDVAVWRWSADSREGINDAEWQRRRAWPVRSDADAPESRRPRQPARPAVDVRTRGAGSEATPSRPAQSVA